MNFLDPAFLISLAAVALPLIVHFFSRRKLPRVMFSSLAFLRRSRRRSMKRINFRRLLLLILRMAAVALIALAFARPLIRGAIVPGTAPSAVCILLDRSFSMGMETESGTLLERAAAVAERIIEQAEDNDRLIIAAVDAGVEKLLDIDGSGTGFAAEVLDTLQPSWKGTALAEGITEGYRLLDESGHGVRELYLISDMRVRGRAEGGRIAPAGLTAARRKTSLYLIPVTPGFSGNAAVLDIYRPGVAIHSGEAVTIGTTVINDSSSPAEAVPVSLYLEGERLINRELRLAPGERRYEEFSFPVDSPGLLEGEIRLGDDRISYDNSRRFVISVIEKIDVLLIGEDQYYLEMALSPGGETGDISLKTAGSRTFTSTDMNESEAVVVGGGPELWDEDLKMLERYLREGGGAVIFVREGVTATAAAISGYSPEVRMRKRRGTLAFPDRIPEILSPFSEEEIRKLCRLNFAVEPAVRGVPRTAEVMRFKDSTPFIWMEKPGEGRAVFLVCRPAPAGGELVLSPYFLPLVQQAVFTVAQGRKPAEEVLVAETAGLEIGADAVIEFEPAGEESGRELQPRLAEGRASIPPVDMPGFITVREQGMVTAKIAVNPDCAGESILDYLEPDAYADSLGLPEAIVIEEDEQVTERIKEARYGREITGAVIVAALILLVAELFVAQGTAGGEEQDVG